MTSGGKKVGRVEKGARIAAASAAFVVASPPAGESNAPQIDHPAHTLVLNETPPSPCEPITVRTADGRLITAQSHPPAVVKQPPAKEHVEPAVHDSPSIGEELPKEAKRTVDELSREPQFVRKDPEPPAPDHGREH
jgi:hypothetical protein